jgi:hypothetical protein
MKLGAQVIRDMRNLIEHPTPTKFIAIHDFKMQSSGKIALPSVEIVRPGEASEVANITPLMTRITDDLVSVTEMLIAFFCALNVQRSYSGLDVEVIELPPEQRGSRKDQRFFYGAWLNGQLARFG